MKIEINEAEAVVICAALTHWIAYLAVHPDGEKAAELSLQPHKIMALQWRIRATCAGAQ